MRLTEPLPGLAGDRDPTACRPCLEEIQKGLLERGAGNQEQLNPLSTTLRFVVIRGLLTYQTLYPHPLHDMSRRNTCLSVSMCVLFLSVCAGER